MKGDFERRGIYESNGDPFPYAGGVRNGLRWIKVSTVIGDQLFQYEISSAKERGTQVKFFTRAIVLGTRGAIQTFRYWFEAVNNGPNVLKEVIKNEFPEFHG